jgi:hypothetical protein
VTWEGLRHQRHSSIQGGKDGLKKRQDGGDSNEASLKDKTALAQIFEEVVANDGRPDGTT